MEPHEGAGRELARRVNHREVLAAFPISAQPGRALVLRTEGPDRGFSWWRSELKPASDGSFAIEFIESLSTEEAVYSGYVDDQRGFFEAYASALVGLVERIKASVDTADPPVHAAAAVQAMAAAHLESIVDDMAEVLADISEGVHCMSDGETTITEPSFLYVDALAAMARARALTVRLRAAALRS